MTGKINLTITEEKIEGVIELREVSIVEKIVVLDSIMNGMNIANYERQLVCKMLAEADGPAPNGNMDGLFANLFG